MASIIKANQLQDFGGNSIITSDGAGNLTAMKTNYPAFFAKKTSNQTIAHAKLTLVTFDTIEFDSAMALLFEVRYLLESGNMALSGRYTSVDYEATQLNGHSVSGADAVDGSNIGGFFTWSFDQ